MFEDLGNLKKDLLIEIKCMYGLNQECSKVLEEYLKSEEYKELELLQSIIIDFVLNDQILAKYQPNWKFRKTFLKQIISILEKNNCEINSQIYDSYIDLINSSECLSTKDDQKYFVVFFSKKNINEKPIVIEQFANAITNGTTGLHIWPACFQLIDFLNRDKTLLENKKILELGAGVGLLGLHCLNSRNINNYIFTDCHSMVLKQIETNVLLNHDQNKVHNNSCRDCKSGDQEKIISIYELNWLELEECTIFKDNTNRDLDLILATDIIFDPDLMSALSKTLSFIWSNQLDSRKLSFYIASTIRNEKTYETFLENLDKEGFKFEILDKNLASSKSSTPDCFIEILKIFK